MLFDCDSNLSGLSRQIGQYTTTLTPTPTLTLTLTLPLFLPLFLTPQVFTCGIGEYGRLGNGSSSDSSVLEALDYINDQVGGGTYL